MKKSQFWTNSWLSIYDWWSVNNTKAMAIMQFITQAATHQ